MAGPNPRPTARRVTSLVGAVISVSAALGVGVLIGLFWYGFANTYGAGVSEAVVTGIVAGLLVGALLLLGMRLARLRVPTGAVMVFAVAATVVVAIGAAYAGNTARTSGWDKAASACDDPVGRDLVELAIASGKAAGGESLPNYGVGLINNSMTDGLTTGECMAMVNASLDHVTDAAASLGWAVDDAGRIVSPSRVVVTVHQEPPEPSTSPLVTLLARR
jgi:hypothetical protein